jgi:antitoxin component of RelBE/YafQ-DinJ toxin-antitoxin module
MSEVSKPFSKSLLNFRVSNQLRNAFDDVCIQLGTSRTAVLVMLMKNFVREQAPSLRMQSTVTQESKKPGKTIKDREKYFGYEQIYW